MNRWQNHGIVRAARCAALVTTLLSTAAVSAQPTAETPLDTPAPVPPVAAAPTLTVRELLVLQTDRYGDVANDKTSIPTSLFVPIIHAGRLKLDGGPDVQARTPMPVGFISFEGQITEPIELELSLASEDAFFHAHWPNDALKSKRQITWLALQEASDAQRVDTRTPESHWLYALRQSEDRLWLRTRDPLRQERFLLYDASLPFKSTLSLTPEDSGLRVASTDHAAAPPFAMILSEDESGIKTAAIRGPWPDEAGVTIELTTPASPQRATVQAALEPLKQVLAERGYNTQEIETATRIVAQARQERSTMSMIYLLPEGAIDSLIDFKIEPAPDQVVRTAIVVVNNVDPDLGTQLEKLIAGLGDTRWKVREQSQRELEAIGLAAIRKVQSEREHADPEVAFRIRQILDAYDLKQQATEE